MTKIKAEQTIVCYTEYNFGYGIDSITVLKGNSTIDLTNAKNYIFNSFNDLYKTVLKILSNNNYYVDRYNEFGARFYNINFINHDNPKLEKYGLAMIEQE